MYPKPTHFHSGAHEMRYGLCLPYDMQFGWPLPSDYSPDYPQCTPNFPSNSTLDPHTQMTDFSFPNMDDPHPSF